MRLFLILAFLCLPIAAMAERLALVIGNAAYSPAPKLQNTLTDAAAYAETFTDLGYKVTLLQDLDRDALEEAVADFADSIRPNDDTVFVFSGHGWSDGEVNYLLPTDISTTQSKKLTKRRSMPLQNGVNGVLDQIRDAGAGLQVAIIDACRNNVFDPKGTKSFGQTRGLSRVQPAQGSFVIFSAGAGQTALDRLPDDTGKNLSVFTRTFLPQLKSGIPLLKAMKNAQLQTVALASEIDHPQRPAFYDETLGDVCLSGTCVVPIVEKDVCAEARAVWGDLKDSRAKPLLDGFIEKYDQCPIYRGLAMTALSDLTIKKPLPDASVVGATNACLNAAAHPDAFTGIEGVNYGDLDGPAAVALCQKAIDAFPYDMRLRTALGRAQSKTKDYDAARKNLQMAAEAGIPNAQFNLADMFQNGQGMQQDTNEALKWYRNAAAQDYKGADRRIGYIFETGLGDVEKDMDKAFYHYKISAERGDKFGQHNLAQMYQNARGTPKDSVKAFEWMRKAAEQGYDRAQNWTGVFYERGTGVDKNSVTANEWYRRAALQGEKWAQTNLAYNLRSGDGIDPDLKEAQEWFEKAVAQDHAEAMYALADLHADYSDPPNNAEAERLYRKAVEVAPKNGKALGKLADFLFFHPKNDPKAKSEGIDFALRGVTAGNGQSMAVMSIYNQRRQKWQLAAAFAIQAAEKGNWYLRNNIENVDARMVREVQKRLKSRKLYKGGIDGKAGPGTQAAIKAL